MFFFLDKKAKEPNHNPKSKILDGIVRQTSPNITDVDGLVVDLSLITRTTKISVHQRLILLMNFLLLFLKKLPILVKSTM